MFARESLWKRLREGRKNTFLRFQRAYVATFLLPRNNNNKHYFSKTKMCRIVRYGIHYLLLEEVDGCLLLGELDVPGLGGDGVEDGGHGLAVHHRGGEVGGGGSHLGLEAGVFFSINCLVGEIKCLRAAKATTTFA